jgi:hypothetical protein
MKTVEQAQAFLAEVREVCRRHGFQMNVEVGGLELWPLKPGEAEISAMGVGLVMEQVGPLTGMPTVVVLK